MPPGSLQARLTRLQYDVAKSVLEYVQEPGTAAADQSHSAELAAQLRDMFTTISRELHDIRLQLADRQTT